MSYDVLFQPIQIGKMKLKNRTVMAPMGPIGYADAFGGFNQRLQDYYVERAAHDVGLIITGICSVDMNIEGIPSIGIPCPTTSPIAFVHSTYPMNERIHAHGAKSILQLTGGLGRSAIPGFVKKSIAPSEAENRFDPNTKHREMTREEIMNLIQKFIMSAAVAKKAGFDGVEVHAVHEGYLLDQFAIAFFNHRTDEFGGSLENRLRVTTEIIKGIKKICGPDFVVSLRYSIKSYMKGLRQGALPGEDFVEVGKDTEEGIEAAKILVNAGCDMLNVDAGTYDSWYWNHPPMYFEGGVYREFGRQIKENVDVPVILAGRMDDPEMAAESIGRDCDLVAYGRPLLADSEFVEKLRTHRLDEIRPCLGCHEGCMGRVSNAPVSCAVNPACGREKIYGLAPALVKKKLLVIGGGVAGMEIARVASLRGHEVILCEKSDRLGGNLIPGGVPDFKRYDRALLAYYKRQMELLEVDVRMNTLVDEAYIDAVNADAIVVATGSVPKKLRMDSEQEILTADSVLLGNIPEAQQICLLGGGLVGCETALWLAQMGKDVSVVEMLPEILGGHGALPHMNHDMLVDLLNYHKVKIHTSTAVTKIGKDSVVAETNGETLEIPAKAVISAVGYQSDNALYEKLSTRKTPVYNVGDSRNVHNIMYAIWDAYEVAREI